MGLRMTMKTMKMASRLPEHNRDNREQSTDYNFLFDIVSVLATKFGLQRQAFWALRIGLLRIPSRRSNDQRRDEMVMEVRHGWGKSVGH